MLRCLQAVQCAPSPQLCELSPVLGWALVMQLSLSHFCSCKQLLVHIPVSNPSKTHWLTKLGFSGTCTLGFVCSSSGTSTHACCVSTGNVLSHRCVLVNAETLSFTGLRRRDYGCSVIDNTNSLQDLGSIAEEEMEKHKRCTMGADI